MAEFGTNRRLEVGALELGDVRCWVNSGKHMPAWSFSEFDPTETSTDQLSRAVGCHFSLAAHSQSARLSVERDVFLGDTCNGASSSSSRFLVV